MNTNKISQFLFLILLTIGAACIRQSNSEGMSLPKRPDIQQGIVAEARQYCSQNNLNTDVFLLVDLSRHSGLKRMFLIDFKSGAKDSFMVSHGCGNSQWTKDHSKENPSISNIEESHCSSVGKYRIGSRGTSIFGNKIKYLLHGLDSSNSLALKRAIVFHSWEYVTDEEIYPRGTAEGWGCPAISIHAFERIDSELQRSTRSVLLWVIKP